MHLEVVLICAILAASQFYNGHNNATKMILYLGAGRVEQVKSATVIGKHGILFNIFEGEI